MRRGAIVQLTLLALLIGGVGDGRLRVYPELAPADRVGAGRPDRLRLLVRDGDLHRHLRDRHRGARVLGVEVPSRARRRLGRARRSTGTRGSRSRGRRSRSRSSPRWRSSRRSSSRGTTASGSNPLRVDVTAQQFAWTFKYPQQKGLTTNVLRLPIHRPTRFTLRALDVHPLVLGSGIRAEAGRRARDDDASDRDAEQARHLSDHLHRALRPRACGDALERGRDVAGRLRQVGSGRRQGGGRRRRRSGRARRSS